MLKTASFSDVSNLDVSNNIYFSDFNNSMFRALLTMSLFPDVNNSVFFFGGGGGVVVVCLFVLLPDVINNAFRFCRLFQWCLFFDVNNSVIFSKPEIERFFCCFFLQSLTTSSFFPYVNNSVFN